MNGTTLTLSIRKLILVPAVISLVITLFRLTGELYRWSPALFNREAGGPGAIVGIVWLVPIFGIYFALKLARAGHGPVTAARAFSHAAAGLVLFLLLFFAITSLTSSSLLAVAQINLAAALAAWLAYRGWPALGRVEVAYGLAARIPVALVMLVAMAADWGTHYELGPPGFPEMALVPQWIWIGLLPQLVFWIAFTVVLGSLFGSLALWLRRSPAPAAASG